MLWTLTRTYSSRERWRSYPGVLRWVRNLADGPVPGGEGEAGALQAKAGLGTGHCFLEIRVARAWFQRIGRERVWTTDQMGRKGLPITVCFQRWKLDCVWTELLVPQQYSWLV